MSHPSVLQDAVAALRALAQKLEASDFHPSDAQAAQFFDALDALLAKALPALPPGDLPFDQSQSSPSQSSPSQSPPNPSPSRRNLDLAMDRSLRITQESVDGAPIGIFRLDSEGRIVSANKTARESLGYTSDEILHLTVFDLDPTMTPEQWRAHRAQTKVTGSRTLLGHHRHKDGRLIPVEIHVKQFVFGGELYSVSFVKDISERVAADQERRRLEAQMLQTQKLESLGILAGGIAHDFNNLLMAMIGNLDLVLGTPAQDSDQRELLLEANKAAHQAADLCRQLLIYAGKGTRQVEPVDLGKVLQEQAAMLGVSASKSVRLVLSLADGLPWIRADVSQLRQIFMNLILNASDAIGRSPGVITLATQAMDCDQDYLDSVGPLEKLLPGRYVCVDVSDTGCGMSDEVRAKIFDPFFSTKTSSRGLGLAAVRGIVHNHGGDIRVTSEVGKGTTFKLLFPVPATMESLPAVSPAVRPWQGHGLVLLVDDEEALRRVGRRMLARLGFETIVASHGAEAIDVFNQRRGEIRYVLLDWTMPEMGGHETIVRLRALDPRIRVVLTSGHAPEEVIQGLLREPFTAFVRKPYLLAELAEAFQGASRDDVDKS